MANVQPTTKIVQTPPKKQSSKQESLSKAKAGKREWKSELASNSVQVVRYGRHDMSIEEMQKEAA
jgi:hypothetical protein